MSKTYETGHAKNLANFNILISFYQGYGAAYNPVQCALKLSNLKTLASTAQTAYEDAKIKQLVYDEVKDERMITFSPLRGLAQRMVAALAACGCSNETLNGAKTINRKIRGRRKNKVSATTAQNPAGHPNDPNPTPAQTDMSI